MFDAGEYSYVISNLMHLSMGLFQVFRIDKNLEVKKIFSTENVWDRIEYEGRFQRESEQYIIASGAYRMNEKDDNKYIFRKRTLLFRVDKSGGFNIDNEWDIGISSANSLVNAGEFVYFGQNKMITRLNTKSGQIDFFTNKNDEELATLIK